MQEQDGRYSFRPATHFGKVAVSEGIITKGSAKDRNTGGSSSSNSKTTTSSKRVKPEELVTANGLKATEIKGIAINLEYIAG